MSLVIAREEPTTRNLTTLTQVKCALGITDNTADALLQRLITSATTLIERHTDRVFAKRLVTEQFGVDESGVPELSPFRVSLSQLPVLMLDAARLDDAEYDITNVVIENDKAGFLFSRDGFSHTNIRAQGIETIRTRFINPIWEFDYSAGYTLPSFPAIKKAFTNAEVDADADTIGIVNHGMSSGDTVKFTTEGTLPGGLVLNRPYLLRDVTDDTFKVTTRPGGAAVDLTSVGDAGPHSVQRQVTLPADLENIAVDLVSTMYAASGRDRTIKSERLGDWSATYATGADMPGGLPDSVKSQLQAWIRY